MRRESSKPGPLLDGLALLVCAGVCALLAAISFRWWGNVVTDVLFAISFIALISDYVRMKRRLKRLEGERSGSRPENDRAS